MSIRVLIADDQALVRGAFSVLVDSADDLEVVAQASNDGVEAVALSKEHHPDVVLTDIRMPEMDGIEATKEILKAHDATAPRILILTTFELDEYVYAALRAGASGFLLKDTPPEQLLEAIRVIASGEALLAPSVTRTLIKEFARRNLFSRPRPEATNLLTPRRLEVLMLIARGQSNSEIAEQLHMSIATAKTHVGRLLSKLDARDRAQLVVFAYESGLMSGD